MQRQSTCRHARRDARRDARGRALFLTATATTLLASASQAQFAPPEAEHSFVGVEGAEPYAMTYRDTLDASIDTTVDTDLVSIFCEAGDVVQVALRSPNGLDPSILVLDPVGATVPDPDDPMNAFNPSCVQGCTIFDEFVAATTGVHTLLISDLGLDDTGPYTLGIEKQPPDRPVPALDYGPTYSVPIDTTVDHDWMTFEGDAGNLVSVGVNSPNGLDPVVNIWAPSGALFQTASCVQGCSISLTALSLPETGTYRVELYDLGHDETGTATISITCLLANCPLPRDDVDLGSTFCSSNPNSTGMNATISARGSTDPADNYFSLAVQDVPAGKLGIFFFGTNPTAVPFAQGVKCIANPVRRLPPLRLGSGAGETYLTPDLTNLPGNTVFTPGSTWLFQFWYRDQNPFATTNLSDGLSVTF